MNGPKHLKTNEAEIPAMRTILSALDSGHLFLLVNGRNGIYCGKVLAEILVSSESAPADDPNIATLLAGPHEVGYDDAQAIVESRYKVKSVFPGAVHRIIPRGEDIWAATDDVDLSPWTGVRGNREGSI